MGNPTGYLGSTLTWEGKQLISAGTNTYAYDENGLRTQKTTSAGTTDYYYNGSVLMGLTTGNDVLLFFYDQRGKVSAVDFNGTYYYYLRNGQGDIVKLIDNNGNAVAEYAYDTWGKQLSCTGTLASTLGVLNPFRYRGYVYDEETQWYYLQSRYYDPETCRFLSADVMLSTGQGVLGHNTYAYCLNNPVNMGDIDGCRADVDLLLQWLFGDGSDQYYDEKSRLVKKIKKSQKMQDHIDRAIDTYKNGEVYDQTSDEFTKDEDGLELYLSLQHFNFSITVIEEIREKGFWFWKHTEKRYVATVTVTDRYNFDSVREWNSFGNDMNNIAYYLHEMGNIGNDFSITATYMYSTKWEKVN